MLWRASLNLDSSTPSFWARACGIDAPQPHHAAARAAVLPIRGAALLGARLFRCHGDTGALGRFRGARIRVSQLRQTQADPRGGEDGSASDDKLLHRWFPFLAGSSGHIDQWSGGRLSGDCVEPAGTMGDGMTSWGCGTGTYLHRLSKP